MKILLGVTGSISAYKTYDLVREWSKIGHVVRVILTKGALNFVSKEMFSYLGADEVFLPEDDFSKTKSGNIPHIALGKWCDRFIIAPSSANTIARLKNGLCDDLLGSTFLAFPQGKPLIIYPAMNVQMFDNEITQENINKLKELPNVFVHPPIEGLLACGDIGKGKLPNIESILDLSLKINPFVKLQNKKVLITAGATLSPLDPVRYLTNPSSGITGYHLAIAFLQNGFDVTVIAGKNATHKLDFLNYLPNFTLLRVSTTKEMFSEVSKRIKDINLYVSSAAIGDIEFPYAHEKIKKETLTKKTIAFELSQDILKYVLENKNSSTKVIGFAAETSTDTEVFLSKWRRKQVDLLIGNYVDSGIVSGKCEKGFKQNENQYFYISKNQIIESKELTKEQLSDDLVSWYLKSN